MRHKWTPDQDAKALALVNGGMTYRQASVAMGLPFNTVRRRVYFLRAGPADIYRRGLTCEGCQKPLSDLAKGDLCRSCAIRAMNADPDFQSKRLAAIGEKWNDPMHRAKMASIGARTLAQVRERPGYREWLVKNGSHIARTVLHRPDIRAKTLQAVSERSNKTRHDIRMAWCPLEYRADYDFLTRTKQLRSAEARQIVEAQMAADKERASATLSPFERQMRALQNGGKIVANDRKPMFGEARRVG